MWIYASVILRIPSIPFNRLCDFHRRSQCQRLQFERNFKRLTSREFDWIDRAIFNDDRVDIAEQDKRTWRGCDSRLSHVEMKTGQADTGRCGISCRSWYWRRYLVTSVMEIVRMSHKSVDYGTVHSRRQSFGVPSQSSSIVICVVTSLWREN